jgi:hypothetical protein
MVAPAQGIACRPPVGRALSENFAVIAHRKHTFAVRNGAKFRGVFPIFGCQTLFSRRNYPGRLRSPVQSALLHFGRREKRVPLKGIPDGLKDIFGMLTSGGKIPANATELLGTLQRAKPA